MPVSFSCIEIRRVRERSGPDERTRGAEFGIHGGGRKRGDSPRHVEKSCGLFNPIGFAMAMQASDLLGYGG